MSDPASSDDPIGGDKKDEATVEVHQPDESDRARADAETPPSAPAPSSRNDPNAPEAPKT